MEFVLNILGFIFVLAVYLLLVHLVARRGFKTGLYYERVFVIALFFLLPAFLWVMWRNPRRGLYYERIPAPKDPQD
jgi:uncharacterized membrane protein YesL